MVLFRLGGLARQDLLTLAFTSALEIALDLGHRLKSD